MTLKNVFKLTPMSLYNIQGLERWLEERADEGLFPVWINGDFTQFHRNEGVPGTRFRLEAANGEEFPETDRLELYRQAGWDYGGTVSKMYFLFYATNPGAPELHTDPVTRGLSLDWLARQVQRARRRMRVWRLAILGLLLLGVLLAWQVEPRRLPLLLVNLSGGGLVYLLWFLWFWRQEEREARTLLGLRHSLELGITPLAPSWTRSRLFWPLSALTLLVMMVGGWLYEQPVPLEDFSRPYVDLQLLESEPLSTYQALFPQERPQDWNHNTASRHFSFLSPSYYTVTQNLFSLKEGTENGFSPFGGEEYRYSPDLTGVYFHLTVPALARMTARAQMAQLELANFTWHYEERQAPGLDFVLLAQTEHDTGFQLVSVAKGGRVAVFRYAGREDLTSRLDVLAAAVA